MNPRFTDCEADALTTVRSRRPDISQIKSNFSENEQRIVENDQSLKKVDPRKEPLRVF